jgi:chromosome partitioning protein
LGDSLSHLAKWETQKKHLDTASYLCDIAIRPFGQVAQTASFSCLATWPKQILKGNSSMEGGKKLEKKTVVISVGNQKGGVGKTTNTIQLASALAERGRLSLIVDLDMTSGATKALRAPTEGWNSSFELLTNAENAEDTIIRNDEEEVPLPHNVHLIPSSRKLAELDTFLAQNPWVIHQNLLVEPINSLRGRYDYIFLDTPPQKTKTTIPALKVADYAILSAMPDHLAVSALGEALLDIATAQKFANTDLMLLGVIVCAMPKPKTRLARELVGYVERTCVDPEGNSLKFATEISRSVVVQEAQRAGQSIFQYQPDHLVADEYRTLAREFEDKLTKLTIEKSGVREEGIVANA